MGKPTGSVSDRDPSHPRRSDALANVARIVDSAADLLSRDPDVSIGDIAQHAGVGRSTLYRHFETREALVGAVRRRARDIAETDEPQFLRPAGELANVASTPLSVPDVLNKVPPFQLGRQIVAEAQRLDGVQSAAIYLVELQGRELRRLAGSTTFPAVLPIHAGVGTEIPREAFDEVRDRVVQRLPGAVVMPLIIRGRATGLLVVVGEGDDALRDLAREAAAALALANDYTDALRTVRRARPTSPAAEIQQNLLPPRIVRVGGATLAGNVLPGYDVGGDWFDFADNEDAVWLGIADLEGSGAWTAGLSAVLLGAFRSARHQGEDPAGAMALMHATLVEVAGSSVPATATVGHWNSATSELAWVAVGPARPLLAHADGTVEELPHVPDCLGSDDLVLPFTVQRRTLAPGQRLVLVSDGVLGRKAADGGTLGLGLDGVGAAIRATLGSTAAATVHAIETALTDHHTDDLQDDATVVVLAPHP